jgi:predicted Zn finger-like uncharacterized protein
MPLQIRCPTCQTAYALTDEQAGKKIRCRKCDTVFPASAVVGTADPEPTVPESPAPRPRQTRPAPAAPRSRGVLLLILVLVVSVVSVVVCMGVSGGGLYWWIAQQPVTNPKPAAADNEGGGPGAAGAFGNAGDMPPFPVLDPPADGDVAAGPVVADAEPPTANADPTNPLGAHVVEPPPADPDPAPAVGGELTAEVLHKVKRATLHLRVTLPDGNVAEGSGFFAVYPGVILTNAHVIGMLHAGTHKPQKIEVTQNSGRADEKKFEAAFFAADRSADLAVLRAVTDVVPPPLEVHSARGLRETQRVYVFGFPFGDALGKAVTVSVSAVSSLREEHGVLRRVQVNGGMNPGNSGGPVVDSHGNVVGVSVSVIPNSQINFAVPGDSVHALLDGRLAGVELEPSYQGPGDAALLPVTVHSVDPLGRIRRAGLEVWTGGKGVSRPASARQPTPEPGDSARQVVNLPSARGDLRAEVPLPPPPAGKVYWVQPRWLDAAGQTHWAAAVATSAAPPVRREGTSLVVRQEAGDRPLEVTSKVAVWGQDLEGRGPALLQTLTARLQENISNVRPQGADVRLQYGKCELTRTANGQKAELAAHERQAIEDLSRMAVLLRVDGQGNPVGSPQLDTHQVPPTSLNEVRRMGDQVQQALDWLAVPVPNREVAVGDSWKAWRTVPVNIAGLPLIGAARMTYTYVGRRTRDGREEGVVSMRGAVRGPLGQFLRMSGDAHGSAAIDLAGGRVRDASLSVLVEVEGTINNQQGSANIALDVAMQRTMP